MLQCIEPAEPGKQSDTAQRVAALASGNSARVYSMEQCRNRNLYAG